MNLQVYGTNQLFNSLSSYFKIQILNKSISLQNNFSNISKITSSIQSSYCGSFSSLSNNFSNILLTITLRIDYFNDSNELNYDIFTFEEMINISTSYYLCDDNDIISCHILDLELINISTPKIDLYILIHCCINT